MVHGMCDARFREIDIRVALKRIHSPDAVPGT
jgi:hypothetical protein